MSARNKTTLYTHLPLGKDIEAFSGYYTPEKECRLQFMDREVLYVTGHVVVETACADGSCKPVNYYYATVPGYVIRWQFEKNKEDFPLTEVEPITDVQIRESIKEVIQKDAPVAHIDFW